MCLRHQITLKLMVMLILIVCSSTQAAFTVTGEPEQQSDDKALSIRANNEALDVDITPIKNSFWVNEKIRLRAQGNQPYYLYLFNIDPNTGEAMMILPNHLQTDNYYSPYKHLVPDRAIEFYGDQPGIERMIMVASKKRLPVNLKSFPSVGNFIKDKSANLEKALGIRFTETQPDYTSSEVFVKSFEIDVRGERQPRGRSSIPGNRAQEPIAFVSTAYNEYFDGDRFKLIFGANRSGFVHLYSLDPYGAYDLLNTSPVDGSSIKTLTIQAAPPYGRHTLIALYSENRHIDHSNIESIMLNAEKSLYVVKQSNRAVAVHTIYVKGY